MSKAKLVLKIDKPHFTVELREKMLAIDLKGSIRNDIEEALENKPILKETIGSIFGIFVPLHLRLSHIDSVHNDETGKVTIKLRFHRDIVLPLEPNEANKLVNKLNQLIPEEKKKDLERVMEEKRVRKIEEEERSVERAVLGSGPYPVPQAPGVLRKVREAEKNIEEEQERED